MHPRRIQIERSRAHAAVVDGLIWRVLTKLRATWEGFEVVHSPTHAVDDISWIPVRYDVISVEPRK